MRQRNSYPKPFKAQVVQECLQPGASVASVALNHGINANVVRKWLLETLHTWMLAQRDLVPDGSATAKALDYSLKRWVALTRYLEDGVVPIDNNWVENQIRPWALGRSNWLFAGSLRSGKRAAAIMSLIQSARLNGHDPYAYLKDVLMRLPTQRASEIADLLPHRWCPNPGRE
ncbi:hypothetical protein E8F06_00860 [Pseudomonas sp. BN411]|nr:hypothetical protein [Pseudomonas sp. BN411]